jgi:hypothetical protein
VERLLFDPLRLEGLFEREPLVFVCAISGPPYPFRWARECPAPPRGYPLGPSRIAVS